MKPLKIAAINFHSIIGNIDENLKNTEKWLKKLQKKRPQIFVFPELALTGYSTKPEILNLAEPIPGPSSKHLIALSAHYQTCIITEIIEKIKNIFYITQ